MATILIVEDESVYRELLLHSLAAQGYTPHAVATGAEAIAVGARLRPTLLLVDWLLGDHIHGLHVVAALRAVDPQLRAILMTGFDAADLRTQAAQFPGCRYLAKPFRLQTLLREVTRAAALALAPPETLPIAVAEVDATGAIGYANAAARALFATTQAGAAATQLAEVIHLDTLGTLETAAAQWHAVVARTAGPLPERWWLGLRTDPGVSTRLLVLTPDEDAYPLYDTAARLLLNHPPPTDLRWPWSGPALLIDADLVTRRLGQQQLELTGALCHTARTPTEGLRLFQRNPTIRVVILAAAASALSNEALADFLAALRRRQPPVCLVGTSPTDQRAAFAALGVPHFLRKPWRAEVLLALWTPAPAHSTCLRQGGDL